MDNMEPIPEAPAAAHKISLITPIRAAIRIRRKIRMFKTNHLHLDLSGRRPLDNTKSCLLRRQLSTEQSVYRASSFDTPNFFTFDTPTLEQVAFSNLKRKKKRRRSRAVLYPGNSKKYLPVEQKSKAKRCLILLVGIICFQILNAIENLDDNVLKYELDGLEKTMHREVFGQKVAIDGIMDLLKDYLATHCHNKPLVISMNGPSGVGKSHMGRILAKHFRAVMDNDFVMQYYVMHNCPKDSDIEACRNNLFDLISDMVTRAEIEEKIPVFIFDELELMPPPLLDTLQGYFYLNQNNEYLNAIYILISNIGGNEVTKFILQNSSSDVVNLRQELQSIIQSSLKQHHRIWDIAEIVPLTLLEKSHIAHCFLDELLREGFYPDNNNIESLTGQLKYYTTEDKQYSITGCKQVVAKVNLLQPYT
ncbi:PREDICTED: torsin-4A [Nanorana parkeri]|uniref:torsin-4A n=1 Tax=Nanorana parkeri TaxID=125878 RepID=UPI0008542F32|nr:PREDICTED: torsin-4A [Nanorana parkeri]